MNGRTRTNVEAALAGEAMAALRYQLFAEQAHREGYPEVAALFASTGTEEQKEHFRELAAELGLIGTTGENLRTALRGEIAEHRSLYPRFAAEAREDGEAAVARRFAELAEDEGRHAALLREQLEDLEVADLEVVGG
jgi:rubrerythrin